MKKTPRRQRSYFRYRSEDDEIYDVSAAKCRDGGCKSAHWPTDHSIFDQSKSVSTLPWAERVKFQCNIIIIVIKKSLTFYALYTMYKKNNSTASIVTHLNRQTMKPTSEVNINADVQVFI